MKQIYSRIAIVSLALMFSAQAFAFVSDTIRHHIKGRYPIEFSSEIEERPTEYKNDKGETIKKHVHSTFALYTDTIRTIVIERDSVLVDSRTHQLYDSLYLPGGNHLHLYLGAGYGSLNYDLQGMGSVSGSMNGIVQLEYAYFFNDNWGLGFGLSFSNNTSMVSLEGSKTWSGVIDSDGEMYNHTVDILRWSERETIHRLSVPVSLQFQTHWGQTKAFGLYADLGASADVNLLNRYNILFGEVEDRAFYPATNLTLRNTHEFHTRDMNGVSPLKVAPVGVGVFADLGFLFKISDNTELSIGGFFHMTPTDINRSTRTEMSFGNETFSFMPPYEGAFASTEASASRPWEAGVKLGMRINAGKRHATESEKKNTEKKAWERRDTTNVVIIRKERIEEHEAKGYTQFIVPPKKTTAPTSYPQQQSDSTYENETVIITTPPTPTPTPTPTTTTTTTPTLTPTPKSTPTPTYQESGHSSNLPSPTTKRSSKYKYHLLYFALDSSEPNSTVVAHIERIAQTLIDNPEKHVVVSGYACELGSAEYNRNISEQRAENVAAMLESLGVDHNRIQVRAYGNTQSKQTDKKQLWKDRRVVVKISE